MLASLSDEVFDDEDAWELEKKEAGNVVLRCNRATPRLKILRARELLMFFASLSHREEEDGEETNLAMPCRYLSEKKKKKKKKGFERIKKLYDQAAAKNNFVHLSKNDKLLRHEQDIT